VRLSIDWVSMGIFLAAYAFSQINKVSLRLRYLGLAIACGAIAGYRFVTFGQHGVNFAITLAAVGLMLFYLVRALQARQPGSSD
jgi:hypothetical protein